MKLLIIMICLFASTGYAYQTKDADGNYIQYDPLEISKDERDQEAKKEAFKNVAKLDFDENESHPEHGRGTF